MSTYYKQTKNPATGKFEKAEWRDDYFGSHHYGVFFNNGSIIDPWKVELETEENYSHLSHSHCWDNKDNPCGIPLEKHTQCCLCDLKYSSEEKPKEDWRIGFNKLFGTNKQYPFNANYSDVTNFISFLIQSTKKEMARDIVDEINLKMGNEFSKLLGEFISTPLDQRSNGWKWLILARARLLLQDDSIINLIKSKYE